MITHGTIRSAAGAAANSAGQRSAGRRSPMRAAVDRSASPDRRGRATPPSLAAARLNDAPHDAARRRSRDASLLERDAAIRRPRPRAISTVASISDERVDSRRVRSPSPHALLRARGRVPRRRIVSRARRPTRERRHACCADGHQAGSRRAGTSARWRRRLATSLSGKTWTGLGSHMRRARTAGAEAIALDAARGRSPGTEPRRRSTRSACTGACKPQRDLEVMTPSVPHEPVSRRVTDRSRRRSSRRGRHRERTTSRRR